jgi:hypothetical protein
MKTTQTSHALALAAFLSVDPTELKPLQYDHYGMPLFSVGGEEYAVGTDQEADKAVTADIQEMVWAFNPDFICSMCGLPSEFEDGIRLMQEKCESANPPLLALVEKQCGLPLFVERAVESDGRGHFLSGYDSEENEVDHEGETFFIYRTN